MTKCNLNLTFLLFALIGNASFATPQADTARGLTRNVQVSSANTLQAIAFAKTQSAADQLARSELQEKLRHRVKQSSRICQRLDTQYLMSCNTDPARIITQDKLPLLTVTYQELTSRAGMKGSKASLSPTQALPIYKTQIDEEIKHLNNFSGNVKVRGLSRRQDKDFATLMMRYSQLAAVIAILGDDRYLSGKIKMPAKTDARQTKVTKLNSINEAASYIAKTLTGKAIYLYPPRPQQAAEITPFAKAFHAELKKKMTHKLSVTSFNNESFSSVYERVNGGVILRCRYFDKNDLLENRMILQLDESAIAGFRTTAVAADFERVLLAKQDNKTDFYGQLATQNGYDDLLFRKGETIKLFARLSKPGYFYIVGHVAGLSGQYSYLVDINEGKGPGLFVIYVSPDQVNRVIDLGEFDVEAPFGVEYLQMVSSTADLKNSLPKYHFDDTLGYYILDLSKGDVLAGLNQVRGLKRNLQSNAYHESLLVYTTMD